MDGPVRSQFIGGGGCSSDRETNHQPTINTKYGSVASNNISSQNSQLGGRGGGGAGHQVAAGHRSGLLDVSGLEPQPKRMGVVYNR